MFSRSSKIANRLFGKISRQCIMLKVENIACGIYVNMHSDKLIL